MSVNRTAAQAFDPRLFLREEELDRAADLCLAAARALWGAARPAFQDAGLGAAHFRILTSIRQRPGRTVSDLREDLAMPKQSLARILDELESGGYLIRSVDQRDRRARRLFLSEDGTAAERACASAIREGLARAFKAAGADSVAGAHAVWAAMLAEKIPESEL